MAFALQRLRQDDMIYAFMSFLPIFQSKNDPIKKKIPQSANQTTDASQGLSDALKQRTLNLLLVHYLNYIAFILISIPIDSNSGGLMRSFHMALSQMTHLRSCNNHKPK